MYIGFLGPFMALNTEIKNDELIIIHIPHYLYEWINYKNKESMYNCKYIKNIIYRYYYY